MKKLFFILIIPFAGFIAANTVFMYQGGFGGGHGLDFYFLLFQFPGIVLVFLFGEKFLIFNDYINIVLIPFILNIFIWCLLIKYLFKNYYS